jgi:hypothetical protein
MGKMGAKKGGGERNASERKEEEEGRDRMRKGSRGRKVR